MLVCYLGSCISAAGGVVEEWYHHSAEWVSSLCRGPCSCWGSSDSPGVQPRDGQHSLGSFLLRRYSCLFVLCRVEMQSLDHCGCFCKHLLWSQCQAQQWWAGLLLISEEKAVEEQVGCEMGRMGTWSGGGTHWRGKQNERKSYAAVEINKDLAPTEGELEASRDACKLGKQD